MVCVSTHLGVDVQDANASGLHHLVDGVCLGAVQVAVVLAVLQEAAGLHAGLHLAAAGERKHAALTLPRPRLPGGVWGKSTKCVCVSVRDKVRQSVCVCVCVFDKVCVLGKGVE